MNKDFTKFSLTIRYTFLAFSIVAGIIYLIFFLKVPKELRTFEHKYIMLLSVLLVFFNDPFYYLTTYQASKFFAIFSVFTVVSYMSCLLVFWLIMI